MNLREYQPGDLEFILHKMDGYYSRRRADKFVLVEHSDAFTCYVAEDDSGIKGFIIMENLGDPINYYMVQINSAEKRKGVGRALVNHVFEKLGKGKHISLCVNTDNIVAIQFYEALGFKRCGYTEEYRKHQDKYWYQIDL